jgi:hypothetical protein
MSVSGAAPWLFACLALLMVAVAAYGAGRLHERRRRLQALREARAPGQLLPQLLDVWQWQTDRHHRLLRLQPPAGQTLDYLAGQYVDVLLRDGSRCARWI